MLTRERVAAALAERGVPLETPIPATVRAELSKALGITPGSVANHLAELRSRAGLRFASGPHAPASSDGIGYVPLVRYAPPPPDAEYCQAWPESGPCQRAASVTRGGCRLCQPCFDGLAAYVESGP